MPPLCGLTVAVIFSDCSLPAVDRGRRHRQGGAGGGAPVGHPARLVPGGVRAEAAGLRRGPDLVRERRLGPGGVEVLTVSTATALHDPDQDHQVPSRLVAGYDPAGPGPPYSSPIPSAGPRPSGRPFGSGGVLLQV